MRSSVKFCRRTLRSSFYLPSRRTLHTRTLSKLSMKPQLQSRRQLQRHITSRHSSASAAQVSIADDDPMFCYQCGHASDGVGCTQAMGICGKTFETMTAEDALVYLTGGLSQYMHRLSKQSIPTDLTEEIRRHFIISMCSTVSNVAFSEERTLDHCEKTAELRDELRTIYRTQQSDLQPFELEEDAAATWEFTDEHSEMAKFRPSIIGPRFQNADCWSLRETALYGLKGALAHFFHCENLYATDPSVYSVEERDSIYASLFAVGNSVMDWNLSMPDGLSLALSVGGINLKVLQHLDASRAHVFGQPRSTTVSGVPKPGKCILMSGHEIVDTYRVLEATKDMNINVYTHGEMLPAHSHPELAKYDHFVGHFGTNWQNQIYEFRNFPGPVVVTTGCSMPPRRQYRKRLFTAHAVAYEGVEHVDLSTSDGLQTIIDCATQMEGFDTQSIEKFIGTAPHRVDHEAVLENSDTILKAMETGTLSDIFVIGGCDGSEHTRNYFTDLAGITPDDSLVFTFGCSKGRLQSLEWPMLGDTPLPRLMDLGQSYSGVIVANHLAKALNTDIDKLPLHFALSWHGQKALALLLTLLNMGIKNIRLGPNIPGFVTPNVMKYLTDNLKLQPISTGEAFKDLDSMLSKETQ